MTRLFPIGLALTLVATVAVAAPADRTGTGGGPNTTITAPHTTSDGTTKPPGDAEGPETSQDKRFQRRIEQQDDKIEGSICSGC